MSICLSPARAAASRRNGAKSRGPRTPEGKACSAQNALRHGLSAQKHLVLDDEDAQAFAALEAAVHEELAPEGVVQRLLAGRIVRAAWRLERAERIEIELLEYRMDRDGDLALALIRDGNGTRSFDTLMRYRGSAQAEFYKALRTLKALQAEARQTEAASSAQPDKPDSRGNPGLPHCGRSCEPASTPARADSRPTRRSPGPAMPQPAAAMRERAANPARPRLPDEPESRGHPGKISGWRGPTSRHAA
jgi:hypothetical protein